MGCAPGSSKERLSVLLNTIPHKVWRVNGSTSEGEEDAEFNKTLHRLGVVGDEDNEFSKTRYKIIVSR
jgi:hypothetical protein